MREVEGEIISRRPEHSVDPPWTGWPSWSELLGEPQNAYPSIHITGTNGKTSTARMADALLRELNLRTGRTTSPHLAEIRERICVDGEPISRERFIEATPSSSLRGAGGRAPAVKLSFFEMTTAMAYAAFAEAPVDVAVIEVGLGGTWDATNVIDAPVAVVTPISLDHTHLLGDNVRDIAEEKSGIIKPGRRRGARAAADRGGRGADAPRRRGGRDGRPRGHRVRRDERQLAVGGQQLALQGPAREYEDIFLPLHGAHQAGNAACAIAAVEAFRVGGGQGGATLEPELVRAAFAKVTSPGRLEVVRRNPAVILDAAHNPGGGPRPRPPLRGVHLRPAGRRLRGDAGQGRARHARRARAGARRDRRHPQLPTALDAGGGAHRAAAEIFGEDRVTVRGPPRRRHRRRRGARREAGRRACRAAPACSSPAPWSPRATPASCSRPDGGELPPEPPVSQPSRHSFTAAELS